jgi:DUF1680 family protein
MDHRNRMLVMNATKRVIFSFAAANLSLLAAITLPLAAGAAEGKQQLLKLQAVPFTQVEITDKFWAPRRETNRIASIPVSLEQLEKASNLRNLELAAARATNGFTGPVFMDSDVYKALEGAAYSLATHPDPELSGKLDRIIATLAAAQMPDGYLNSYYQIKEPTRRWTNLRDNHELYCAGHLFEAAVAHYQATAKRDFLEVAVKLADHVDSVFGPGKRLGYPGHPEIELALIKLWRVTSQLRYFNLARFFVENRGRKFFAEEHRTPLDRYDGTYWQDDIPIYEHRNIKGHAVRAAYLLSGATDVAAETGDPGLLRMLQRVWRNTIERNTYLTGGIGPSSHNEGFTVDYDLPNLSAYQETCATIALALWNHRLALLHGDARYADIVERALYNGVLAGVSQDGRRFFYVNPLESLGQHHRAPWFGCACCPPNITRTLASLGGYAYATSDNALWVNLYIQGSVKTLVRGRPVSLRVTTDYPWEGKVVLEPQLQAPVEFALRLRLPGWCEGAALKLNGQPAGELKVERGYVVVSRNWRSGDVVELTLPMPARRVLAHPNVKADRGLVALQRGPLVYCLEQVDQPEALSSICLPDVAGLKAVKEPNLLGGVMVLTAQAQGAQELNWDRALYQPAPVGRPVAIRAIPYYAWDNRAAGPMKVWLPTTPPSPAGGGPESQAKVSVSFANSNCQPQGINDGVEPGNSAEQPALLCHWWPHKNTEEWAQYTWKAPKTFDGAKVYWFDDSRRGGGCQLPESWKILYREGEEWKPVAGVSGYPIKLDGWCEVEFAPVTTTALRLGVKLRPNWAAGAHEWKVREAEDE